MTLRLSIQRKPNQLGSNTFDLLVNGDGRHFTFHIRNNEITYSQHNWEALLDDQEKLTVFNTILGEYRKFSEKDCGMFAASAAIAEITDGNGRKRDKIFVSCNTNEATAYNKNCAEANLVSIMQQLSKNQGKIRTIYLMTGKAEREKTMSLQEMEDPILPCGRCSDILQANCLPDAILINLPANNGTARLVLDTESKALSDVQKGRAWQIPIHDALLAYSHMTLTGEAKGHMVKGWRELVKGSGYQAPTYSGKGENLHNLWKRYAESPDSMSQKERWVARISMKAATNASTGRHSIPALDVDSSLTSINNHMVSEINKAYLARNPEPGKEEPKPTKIRCAIIRLADGTFHQAIEAESKNDYATPPAEVMALAGNTLANQPITDIWVMELNPENIKTGTMDTSRKEALERLFKRRNKEDGISDATGMPIKDTINITFIPYNRGNLKPDVIKNISISRPFREFFPSAFSGSRHHGMDGNGSGISCC
ncbi:MAG: hypothetical protein U1E36_03955 [Rickettsiales bacterium]